MIRLAIDVEHIWNSNQSTNLYRDCLLSILFITTENKRMLRSFWIEVALSMFALRQISLVYLLFINVTTLYSFIVMHFVWRANAEKKMIQNNTVNIPEIYCRRRKKPNKSKIDNWKIDMLFQTSSKTFGRVKVTVSYTLFVWIYYMLLYASRLFSHRILIE